MAKRPGKPRASDAWGTELPPERTERIQFKVSTDEIAAIDEFRFQTRVPNRATAIRELVRRGLGAPKQSGDNRFKAGGAASASAHGPYVKNVRLSSGCPTLLQPRCAAVGS